jgi:hypothetical protein
MSPNDEALIPGAPIWTIACRTVEPRAMRMPISRVLRHDICYQREDRPHQQQSQRRHRAQECHFNTLCRQGLRSKSCMPEAGEGQAGSSRQRVASARSTLPPTGCADNPTWLEPDVKQ